MHMKTRGKILIVDDTVHTVKLLSKIFHSDGYDTIEAHDGEEGLKKMEEHGPDLIVLDMMMPKLDGLEVCKRVKTDENTKHTPIIMLTGKSGVSDKVKGLEIGADDYMTKPFHRKELLARARSLLTQKAAKERLVQEEKLAALQRMMDEVSHEIINPVVSIGGFARRVYESLPEGGQNKKYMKTILHNAAALEKMVRELVQLKGASLSYVEAVDVNEIIVKALGMLNQKIEENSIDVKMNLMTLPPVVDADRENLKRAISNIIENGIEAMKNETRVLKISTQANEGYFEVQISDTGKGVSPDEIKSVFDPFYTSKIYGPGLGLTFALKTIQSHKGMISVDSQEGGGTVFNIRLPMRRNSSS
jgi:signal transduction histidine kinase